MPHAFKNIEFNNALGAGLCFHCGLQFFRKAPIVYAEIDGLQTIVAFHRECWESEGGPDGR